MIDLYGSVTNAIVDALAAAPGRHELPWHRTHLEIPRNAISDRPYHGINVVTLWVTAAQACYPNGAWATFRQWQAAGARVRKGERGVPIVFYREVEREPEATRADGGPAHSRRVARAYHVFNAAQVDDWGPPSPTPALPETERQAHADAFFAAVNATVVHEGERAFYRPSTDTIHMPPFRTFRSPLGYYSVLGHEHIHWTGAASRLDRRLETRRSDLAYAAEELVAELGAAFLCAALALTPEPQPDHAAYIASWQTLLRDDKRAVFRAASLAAQAVDYLSVKAHDHRRSAPDQEAA